MIKLFRNKNTGIDAFDNVMRRANEVHAMNNVEGLFDLIKIIMMPIQAKHISDAYFQDDHGGLDSIECYQDLGLKFTSEPKIEGELAYSLYEECQVDTDKFTKSISLASDTLLPTSWHPFSIVNMLGKIGAKEKYKCGEFKQSTNHMVLYTYPLDVVWVHGGNHSITQGILRGEGVLKPEEIMDLSALIEIVRFDGQFWRAINSENIIGRPRYQEFGEAWEIGRLINRLQPSPFE